MRKFFPAEELLQSVLRQSILALEGGKKPWRMQKFRGGWKTIFYDSCFLRVGVEFNLGTRAVSVNA